MFYHSPHIPCLFWYYVFSGFFTMRPYSSLIFCYSDILFSSFQDESSFPIIPEFYNSPEIYSCAQYFFLNSVLFVSSLSVSFLFQSSCFPSWCYFSQLCLRLCFQPISSPCENFFGMIMDLTFLCTECEPELFACTCWEVPAGGPAEYKSDSISGIVCNTTSCLCTNCVIRVLQLLTWPPQTSLYSRRF